jgi:hypothetical protein
MPRAAVTESAMARAFLLLLLAPAAAMAEGELARTSSDYLSRMDDDRDGRVSLVEYQAFLSHGFYSLDTNRDGQIDRAELGVRSSNRRTPITLADHRASLARTFARQDANGDAFLDQREIAAPPR